MTTYILKSPDKNILPWLANISFSVMVWFLIWKGGSQIFVDNQKLALSYKGVEAPALGSSKGNIIFDPSKICSDKIY